MVGIPHCQQLIFWLNMSFADYFQMTFKSCWVWLQIFFCFRCILHKVVHQYLRLNIFRYWCTSWMNFDSDQYFFCTLSVLLLKNRFKKMWAIFSVLIKCAMVLSNDLARHSAVNFLIKYVIYWLFSKHFLAYLVRLQILSSFKILCPK